MHLRFPLLPLWDRISEPVNITVCEKCECLHDHGMVSSAVLIILMYAFAPWIYRLFTTDSAVIVHGVHMSRFLLPSYFIYVIIGILSGALRGTGKVLVPMLLTCGGVCS